jgi:hypothetical protein
LWEEYRYRHELCWRIPIQVTAAAVILATLPFVECRVVYELGHLILCVPLIGVALNVFSLLIMRPELQRLRIVRDHYRVLQQAQLDVKTDGSTLRPFTAESESVLTFSGRVELYLWSVLTLQVSNAVILAMVWIPYIHRAGCPC